MIGKAYCENREKLVKIEQEQIQDFFDVLKDKAIRTVFQPIVDLHSGEVLAYEALSRTTNDCSLSIDKLFSLADHLGQVWNLEKLCRGKALKASKHKPDKVKIFLNVDANVILDPEFVKGFTKESLKFYGLETRDVVFELTERSSVEDTQVFQQVVGHYKAQGYQIAIDDAGSGYSNLNRIGFVEPQYIKIDMELIRNIDINRGKRSMVEVMSKFCEEMGYKLIAEGIETENEMKTLIEIGIPYGQGYYLQKPDSEFKKNKKGHKRKFT